MPVQVPLQLPAGSSASAASGVGAVRGLATDLGIGAFVLAVLLWVVLLVWVISNETASRPPASQRSGSMQDAQQSLAEHFVAGDMTTREFVERGSALDWAPGPEWCVPHRTWTEQTSAPRGQDAHLV